MNFKDLAKLLIDLDDYSTATLALESINNESNTLQLIEKLITSYREDSLTLLKTLFLEKDKSQSSNLIELPRKQTGSFESLNSIQQLILVTFYKINDKASSGDVIKYGQRLLSYFPDLSQNKSWSEMLVSKPDVTRLTALIRTNIRGLARKGYLEIDEQQSQGNRNIYYLSSLGLETITPVIHHYGEEEVGQLTTPTAACE